MFIPYVDQNVLVFGHPTGSFTAKITIVCGYYVDVQFTHSACELVCTHITSFCHIEMISEFRGKVNHARHGTERFVLKNDSVQEKKMHITMFNNVDSNFMAEKRFFIDEEKSMIEENSSQNDTQQHDELSHDHKKDLLRKREKIKSWGNKFFIMSDNDRPPQEIEGLLGEDPSFLHFHVRVRTLCELFEKELQGVTVAQFETLLL